MTEIKKCSVEGCKRSYRAKGYCDFHFKKWRNGELPHPPYKTCLEAVCRKPRKGSGLCEDHEKSKVVATVPAVAPKEEAVKEAPQPKAEVKEAPKEEAPPAA